MSLPFVGRFGAINDYGGVMETRVMKIRLATRPKQHVEKISQIWERIKMQSSHHYIEAN